MKNLEALGGTLFLSLWCSEKLNISFCWQRPQNYCANSFNWWTIVVHFTHRWLWHSGVLGGWLCFCTFRGELFHYRNANSVLLSKTNHMKVWNGDHSNNMGLWQPLLIEEWQIWWVTSLLWACFLIGVFEDDLGEGVEDIAWCTVSSAVSISSTGELDHEENQEPAERWD